MEYLNIVIPMAGRGQRFIDAGYKLPKPLIDVLGKSMIERVMDNLKPSCNHRFILIAQKDDRIGDHLVMGQLDKIIELTQTTDGAVCTILKARRFINNDHPLLLANCDQLANIDIDEMISDLNAIAIFPSNKPHHSYIQFDKNRIVTEIIEKKVISNHAVTGIYYFAKGSDFVKAADQIIKSDNRTLGEFYVSTVLEYLIQHKHQFRAIDSECAILGTPEELQLFQMAYRVGANLA